MTLAGLEAAAHDALAHDALALRQVASIVLATAVTMLPACGRTSLSSQISFGMDGAADDSDSIADGREPADGAVDQRDGSAGCVGIVTIASHQACPVAIATDSRNIYWTDYGNCANGTVTGSVVTAPLCGGRAATLAPMEEYAYSIAVDTENIYWSDYGDTVKKVAKGGGRSRFLRRARARLAL
jgi:hypothetical protein